MHFFCFHFKFILLNSTKKNISPFRRSKLLRALSPTQLCTYSMFQFGPDLWVCNICESNFFAFSLNRQCGVSVGVEVAYNHSAKRPQTERQNSIKLIKFLWVKVELFSKSINICIRFVYFLLLAKEKPRKSFVYVSIFVCVRYCVSVIDWKVVKSRNKIQLYLFVVHSLRVFFI